jgi:hypothetical protein
MLAAGPAAFSVEDTALSRLHIAPFNQELLKVYVPPSIQPLVSNISYHSTQTFPELGFGYIELPAAEAQKLKKKLNGSVMKGKKVKVQDAQPEKRKAIVEEGIGGDETDRPRKKTKKEKKQDGVISGVELPGDRKVKRGWTEPRTRDKSKKNRKETNTKPQKKSQYTNEPEVLFRTKLPANVATLQSKSTRSAIEKVKGSVNNSTEVTVHEFANTKKYPNFLRDTSTQRTKKPSAEYVKGTGWVDEDGNVIEPETKRQRSIQKQTSLDEPSSTEENEHFSEILSNNASSSEKTVATDDEESSVLSSSSVVSSTSSDDSDDSESEKPGLEVRVSSPTPPTSAATPNEVHPLEAIFKRPKQPSSAKLAPIKTSFSFFGADVDVGAGEDGNEKSTGLKEPVTPFTKQDLQWREIRSAAPTPDTAAIGGRFDAPWKGYEDEEDGDEDEYEEGQNDTVVRGVAGGGLPSVALQNGEKKESEFAKLFWQNRAENNQAWKKRRAEVLKSQRKKRNRALTEKLR